MKILINNGKKTIINGKIQYIILNSNEWYKKKILYE